MNFIGEESEDPFKSIGISATKAAETLKKAFEGKGNKDIKAYLTRLGYDINSFDEMLASGNSAELYKLYVNTIVAANKKLGTIDAKAMLKLGLNIEGMSKGFHESV
jgi:hypothetical protein